MLRHDYDAAFFSRHDAAMIRRRMMMPRHMRACACPPRYAMMRYRCFEAALFHAAAAAMLLRYMMPLRRASCQRCVHAATRDDAMHICCCL